MGRIMGGMNLIMKDSQLMNSDELRPFPRSSEALPFREQSRAETYICGLRECYASRYEYLSRLRAEKGPIK